ncbi:restriction endonuclease subunit S [uncultured Brachyspira sp.]|uniref:restriction endonuclease subunit S n=1 Tax=uncultured Brachyspira sp. TaxID=221953 RepID=UPI00260E8CD5|nr:restriction endonuclease subunit S [uncultured Brachyspira sp.]
MTYPLPTGWQEKKIGEIFSFIKNYSNSRAELNDYDDISYIHYGDIHKHYRHRIECNKVDFPKISAEKLSKDINNISYVENGDLIVVDASEDYEGTCISAEIKNLNYKLVSGLHTFLLRDKNKIFADGYRGYIFYNHDVHIQCCKVATGISVYGISQENLKNIKIMIPPLDEQKRIAEVLSLCDEVIENLTELIEKKEQYKKGVMQRLLSGEVRFKGFKDEWTFKSLEKLCNIKKGEQKNKLDLVENGKYPVLSGGMDFSGYYNSYNREANTITISEGGNSCGYVNFIKTKFWASGHCYTLHDVNIDSLFLYQCLKYNENKIMKLRLGSGLPNIQLSYIREYTLKIPNSIEEQKKIAGLLSVIDEEIENLKKQLELRKQQKKGLMQRLLTGEVRI